MTTSPEERALALIEGFPQKGPPRDQREWPKIQEGMKQAVRDGDQDMLFALHHACGDRELLGGWPRETAWRSAGLIPEAPALRRFLVRAKNPPAPSPWREPKLTDGPARILGAMLAHAQDDELLERELEHFGPEPALQNLFACWVQERVLRGSLIGRSAFAQQFCSSSGARSRPVTRCAAFRSRPSPSRRASWRSRPAASTRTTPGLSPGAM